MRKRCIPPSAAFSSLRLGSLKGKLPLEISNELVNTASKELTVTVTNTLLDAEKSPVCSLSASALIPAGEKALLVTSGQLASPHLWSPDMPYLYTLSTQISFQSSFLGQTPQTFTSVADTQRVGDTQYPF